MDEENPKNTFRKNEIKLWLDQKAKNENSQKISENILDESAACDSFSLKMEAAQNTFACSLRARICSPLINLTKASQPHLILTSLA